MIISVNQLTKHYRVKQPAGLVKDLFYPDFIKKSAIENITFDIKKGESVALLGPNGAGKTTIMKILSGLVYPSSGSVEVLGYFPFDRKNEYLQRIGLVMGNKTGLDWDLTPFQSFELYKKIYHISTEDFKERISSLTHMLHVETSLQTQVRKLSLGERMKMELIGAIIHQPDILFLDEPTIGLDIVSKHTIREFLREVQKKFGVTLLLTSHDMDDVEKVCDRVIVINKGLKVYDDSLERLTKEYNKERYVKVVFDELPQKIPLVKTATLLEEEPTHILYRVMQSHLSELLAAVTKERELVDVEISSTPLEEIITDIYKSTSKIVS